MAVQLIIVGSRKKNHSHANGENVTKRDDEPPKNPDRRVMIFGIGKKEQRLPGPKDVNPLDHQHNGQRQYTNDLQSHWGTNLYLTLVHAERVTATEKPGMPMEGPPAIPDAFAIPCKPTRKGELSPPETEVPLKISSAP